MKIESLVSIVAASKTKKERRLAIKNSWSEVEKQERRQIAIESQLRLARLISLLDKQDNRIDELTQLAACG